MQRYFIKHIKKIIFPTNNIYILLISVFFTFSAIAQNETDLDLFLDTSYDLIEDRLSCIEKTIPIIFNEKVKLFVDYFSIRNRDYIKMIIEKKNLYFPIFEEYLNKYGMPEELKYLSVIESGLNPNAISRAGAGGLWQFMPATGKMYRLSQNWYIDERMDPYKSTEAACKYLKQLYEMFDDWELALAAYNTGPGNVRRAIRRSGYKKTFWEIYKFLPRETRSYLPQFIAIIYTLNYADELNFSMNELNPEYPIIYDTIRVNSYLHLETFASQLNLCEDDLIKLNPHIIRGAIPDKAKNYPLRIPIDLAKEIRKNRTFLLDTAGKVGKKELAYLARNTPGSTYGRTKKIYRVRSGDVLGLIANRYHVRVSDLKKWNRIKGSLIRVGQRLNIWVLPYYNSKTKFQYNVKNFPNQVPSPTSGSEYYTVQSGDSLWSISKKFDNLDIDKLKSLNNLTSSKIKPGQKLRISK